MTVQFDRIVVRHVDAGACYDLAATECAVELRSHPRSDDEVGVGVEADDLHLSSQQAAASEEMYVCTVLSPTPSASAIWLPMSLVK